MHLVKILKDKLLEFSREHVLNDVFYSYPHKMNVEVGNAVMPIGVLLTPYEWKVDVDGIVAREKGKFRVYFLTRQKELDFDPDKNEVLIDNMIAIAVRFVKELRGNKMIHLENTEIEGASIYDATDRNLTGCRLTLEIKENQGRCIEPEGGC